MRVIGHMLTHNELGRYLRTSLPWLAEITNGNILVYDDRSDDGTAEYVNELRLPLVVRTDSTPSFVEDESALRGAAWRALEQSWFPTEDDWILCVDADEFVVSNAMHATADAAAVRHQIEEAAAEASAVTFRVQEVFDRTEARWPLVRIDGYWRDILAPRLMRWRPGGKFHPRREGGGSVPSNWPKATTINSALSILHYGYARPEDRQERLLRYAAGLGHNPVHIASISRPPSLRPWTGMAPPFFE
jgi:hypothetical protein